MCTDLSKCFTCDKEIPCIGCNGCPDGVKKQEKENPIRDKKKFPSKIMKPSIGDKVFCLLNGNGIVNDVYPSDTGIVIEVAFPFGMVEYTSRGMLLCNSTGRRVLFSGHDLYYEIHEPEPEPEWGWANLYIGKNGKVLTKQGYPTEEKAREQIHKETAIDPGYDYVDTIELRPARYQAKVKKISYNKKD